MRFLFHEMQDRNNIRPAGEFAISDLMSGDLAFKAPKAENHLLDRDVSLGLPSPPRLKGDYCLASNWWAINGKVCL